MLLLTTVRSSSLSCSIFTQRTEVKKWKNIEWMLKIKLLSLIKRTPQLFFIFIYLLQFSESRGFKHVVHGPKPAHPVSENFRLITELMNSGLFQLCCLQNACRALWMMMMMKKKSSIITSLWIITETKYAKTLSPLIICVLNGCFVKCEQWL